ncbi:MAG: hypothetical protein L5656_06755 [Thermanaeromonas sp.]|uniref:hypothetical protein n=1 Tax=Thermanaeromonas sp. TaxID=2003697 RepID=UPI00244077D6|nr:hypothetical protein [Thermanaeromonas sp.]MCG0278216.1 hypothetical protein [Thermanaeromonas sp.]
MRKLAIGYAQPVAVLGGGQIGQKEKKKKIIVRQMINTLAAPYERLSFIVVKDGMAYQIITL